MTGVYSVTQINTYIKNMFAQDFVLNSVRVQGEISNCKYHTSGHIYFTLKDSGGTLSAVMFSGRRKGLNFRLSDGMQVVVEGSIEVYVKGGSYQIYAEQITQAGVGALYEKYEKLKEKLNDMGLFAPEYKQPVPRYASRVGVVTAPTGAAIQDIINITGRRNPYVQLILCPAKVQGEGAAQSVARAIKKLDQAGVDVMIVGRGGGSLEDLWAFNEEIVARAIFDARTPVISAVGHETDYTIADFAADLRAPTPSAAAELAVYDIEDFEKELGQKKIRLQRAMGSILRSVKYHSSQAALKLDGQSPSGKLRLMKDRAANAALRLSRSGPGNRLNDLRNAAGNDRSRLASAIKGCVSVFRNRLQLDAERLKGLSPLEKLSAGYAWVSDPDGRHIRSVGDLEENELIRIRLIDGSAFAHVRSTEPDERI